MKKIISLLVVAVLSTFTTNAQLVAEYTFGTSPGTASPSYVNYVVLSSASNVNIGPGQIATPPFVTGNPGMARFAQNWTTNATTPDLLNQHFRLTLTKALSADVTVTRIDLQEARSDQGPRTFQVRTSLDGFTSVVWQQSILPLPFDPGPTVWRSWTILVNLPILPPSIEIRFYAFNGDANTGAWRIDNVRIYASITNLPIELISFEASAEKDKVRLDWVTASERDNDYFTVLRSSDPTLVDSWEEVTRVGSVGDSQTSTFYNDFDPDPLDGTSYYKLRQTDLDSTFTESSMVPVNFIRNLTLSVGDDALIEGQNSYLIDGLGRVIAFERVHTLKQPGTYFLQGENNQVVRLHVLL